MQFKLKYSGAYVAVENKFEPPTGSWRFQKPVVKFSKCCQCGSCYFLCPNGSMAEKDGYFEPNLDFCKGCGICASVCPVNAIVMAREE